MEPFLGQIQAFGFNFAPRGWAKCEGQLISIAQNTALFSLLGTLYGGDGRTTFALPDLRGRMPMHEGRGPGLTVRTLGEKGGAESHTLTTAQIPSHSHAVQPGATAGKASLDTPVGNFPANEGGNAYAKSADAKMGAFQTDPTGGSQAHNNMPPYVVLNWCIAIQGIFPSRS